VVGRLANFHCADPDDGGGGEAGRGLRRHGAGAGREQAAGGAARGGGPGGGGARTGCGAARGPGASAGGRAAELGDQQLLDHQDGADREDHGERLVGISQLLAEGRAALALLEVAPHRRGEALQALGRLAQIEADLVAGHLPRLGRLGERHTRAYEEGLDAGHRGVHRLGDLLVGESVDLTQQQGRALSLGEALHVLEQEAEVLALVDLVGGGLPALGEVDVHRVHADGLLAAQVVQ
jgi:hypothetical protein